MRSFIVMVVLATPPFGTAISHGATVLEFTDKEAWFASVGEVTTITFTGYAHGTPLIDQYIDRGVVFTTPAVFFYSPKGFPNDEWGAVRFGQTMRLSFTQPIAWVAVDHPANLYFRLFSQGEMIYQTDWPGFGENGTDKAFFAGLVSSILFDELEIIRPPFGPFIVAIDDLHFGPPIPAPGVLVLLGIGALTFHRRERVP
jgi:hypothetical protein